MSLYDNYFYLTIFVYHKLLYFIQSEKNSHTFNVRCNLLANTTVTDISKS